MQLVPALADSLVGSHFSMQGGRKLVDVSAARMITDAALLLLLPKDTSVGLIRGENTLKALLTLRFVG